MFDASSKPIWHRAIAATLLVVGLQSVVVGIMEALATHYLYRGLFHPSQSVDEINRSLDILNRVALLSFAGIEGMGLLVGTWIAADMLFPSRPALKRIAGVIGILMLMMVTYPLLYVFYSEGCFVETGWSEIEALPDGPPVHSWCCGYRRVWSWTPMAAGVVLMVLAEVLCRWPRPIAARVGEAQALSHLRHL